MPKFRDLANQTFGRLTALTRDRMPRTNLIGWHCACSCGGSALVASGSLTSGNTMSCGCIAREIFIRRHQTHGKSKTPEYLSWCAMRRRCKDTNDDWYPSYGGRGISVCERWDDFVTFLSDMGEKPSKAHSLDRIDVNGNYDPSNCRWATPKVQARNTRACEMLTYNGETKNIADWADQFGINYRTIKSRTYQMGWSAEKAITTPVNHKKPRAQ